MNNGAPVFEDIPNAEINEQGLIERPIVVIDDQVVFPNVMSMISPSQENKDVIDYALDIGQTVIAIANHDNASLEQNTIGAEVAIGELIGITDSATAIVIQGRRRVRITDYVHGDTQFTRAKAEVLRDVVQDEDYVHTLMDEILDMFQQCVDYNDDIPDSVAAAILDHDKLSEVGDMIAATLPLSIEEQQQFLETLTLDERLGLLQSALKDELSRLEIREDMNHQVNQEMARVQREMYLREQMRVIQTELGEDDIFQQEIDELEAKLEAMWLPDEVRETAHKELSRLAIAAPISPESGVIRTYLDWILSLPWSHETEDLLDVQHAEKMLNDDHYGLGKVKDRILEYIAVRKLAKDKMRSPILCFVGPPGVGKTSMGRSIANALNRKFARVSLGGIRDEAEIRGHRRTYIGALPGRIIQTMRRAGTMNPVIMLDEIDKLGADFRGDPASALLEVLDPEQNFEFSDHYLEVPYDLSKVLFITTANELYPMPEALEDRMEIIEFRGYTEEEKVEIARQFLMSKQLESHGLDNRGVKIENGALQTIIREYTHEAGVRNLEREIANVYRKVAKLVASERKYPKRIRASMVSDLLGPPYFVRTRVNKEDSIGIVTGLVWTSGGGDTQTVEVSLVPGKGNVTMTGQLGDVLQESAQAALSYLRSRANDLSIPHDDFDNYDLHIHLPEGAVPKDGPSAGITLATAMTSAFTERKVRSDVAMTGEITLRGHILPVGGIKEKVLAARRNQIKNLILPPDNKKDLADVPKHAVKDLNILFADHMQQVLEWVLLESPETRERDKNKLDDDISEDASDD